MAAGLKTKLGPWKLTSVVHRVAVLSTAHRLKRLPNPCEEPAVRTLLGRARRASVKRGKRSAKKTAITKAELEAMLATCDDSLEGLRDRALLCFGFASGGRRRSESLRPTCAICAGQGRRRISTSWSTARPTQRAGPTKGSTPDKPFWIALPRRSPLGYMY